MAKKVLLIDADSSIPNLALMKLSTYYKNKGYEITLLRLRLGGFKKPRIKKVINAKFYDMVFCSIIFTVNKDVVEVRGCDKVVFGGTGYDVCAKLDDEIDKCEPDYSIYPDNDTAIGFITRGCIRHCYFCFVPKKEGMLYFYKDWKEIVKPQFKKVRFLDNNFLAYEKANEVMKELIAANIKVSFNEGLDFRLVDEEKAKLLSQLNYYPSEYIFAFDDISYLPMIKAKYKIIKKYLKKDWVIKFYCYVNKNMPISSTVKRIEWCKKNKALCYIMRDKNCWESKNKVFYKDIATYCEPIYFKNQTFEQFIKRYTKNRARMVNSIKTYNEGLL